MEKIIYTTWVACELQNKGFEILRIEPHPREKGLNCYVFNETVDFLKAFTEITHKEK